MYQWGDPAGCHLRLGVSFEERAEPWRRLVVDDGHHRVVVESLIGWQKKGEVLDLNLGWGLPRVGFRIAPGMKMGCDQRDRCLIVS